ncbi:hypothetical protein Dimus_016524 [Dionaea muscipula]
MSSAPRLSKTKDRRRWRDVLMNEFGSMDDGVMEDGWINILIDFMSPINGTFTPKVDGKEFSCWVEEGCSAIEHSLLDHHVVPESPGSELGIASLSMGAGAAMDVPKGKRMYQDLGESSPSVDGDWATDPPSRQETSSEAACVGDVLDPKSCCDGGGLEVFRMSFIELNENFGDKLEHGNNWCIYSNVKKNSMHCP